MDRWLVRRGATAKLYLPIPVKDADVMGSAVKPPTCLVCVPLSAQGQGHSLKCCSSVYKLFHCFVLFIRL